MRIKIYTTGGSIDKSYSTQDSAFVVADPQIEAILREANTGFEYEVESILKKDSLEITDDDRRAILDRVKTDPHRHIIITHGTDTMIATAQVLSQIRDKVIVLTGAMQPAAFNVGCAALAVQTLAEGVYVVMNGRIFDPHGARKNLELDRFEEHP